jgi:CheY-like chemotaxis protein
MTPRPHPPDPSPPTTGATILVVENDPSNSLLAGKMLEALGYRAKFAANGQEAVDAFRSESFAAILMDMLMPVMDGMLATKRIRELEVDSGTRIPIIAITANALPIHKKICLAAGMDDYLAKPFRKAQLAEKLARWLPAG